MPHNFLILLSVLVFNLPIIIYSPVVSADNRTELTHNQAVLANILALTSVPSASMVGQGVLTYAFFQVYQATLYAPQGRWQPSQPFALSLEYYYAIDGKDIADKSIKEMRRQGFTDEIKLAAWNSQMKTIFPNVKKGTILSAVYLPGKQTTFFDNDKTIGFVKGDDFGRLFFGIWLSEQTSEPKLRLDLLGLS